MRLISPEMLSALTVDGPNSTKIHSTLRHQSPAYYEELMSVIQAIKSADTAADVIIIIIISSDESECEDYSSHCQRGTR
eukprot:5767136-Amphidinium_carterae.1